MKTKPTMNSIIISIGIIVCVVLHQSINNDLEKSKEKMTIECSNQGKVIATFYTNSGDKYYGCKEESKRETTQNYSENK